jgi:hypothetical protein
LQSAALPLCQLCIKPFQKSETSHSFTVVLLKTLNKNLKSHYPWCVTCVHFRLSFG